MADINATAATPATTLSMEDINATAATPATTVATAQLIDNGSTSMPPSNGLGLHTPEGVDLFMSLKDDLLDVRDTYEHSLDATDPKSPYTIGAPR